ncbi:MAG: hypothetical protein FJX23_00625 [Alphaproteobacteria bacterium]|nr:hypothetical protein [Alphaproteobacteria bacterium]
MAKLSKVMMAVCAGALMTACGPTTPPPSADQIRAMHAQQCDEYGFDRQSTAFANCLLELDMQRKEDARAARYSYGGPYYSGGFYSGGSRYHRRSGISTGIGFGF